MITRVSLLLIFLAGLLCAQPYQTPDYCQNPSIAKISAAVNITTATTTQLVAASAGKGVHVCYAFLNVVGTSPVLTFKTGTQASSACDTGTASITGAIPVATTTNFTTSANGGGYTQFSGASSGQLCLTTGGTITSVEGWLVYVQL